MRRLVTIAAAVATMCLAVPALADPPPHTPTATPFDGIPTVGPIFRGPLALGHDCTASVVASPAHDLLLTAAHCVYGLATGWSFVPGYDQGRKPYGVWHVVAAYVDHAWQTDQDPQHDFAVLRVARKDGFGVQDVVGANVLAAAPKTGSRILDVAYNAGVNDQPIRCRPRVYYTAGFPSFNCHGYVGGSSGSPWLQRIGHHTYVRGIIGGLHQGGCYEYTSYSSRFRWSMYALLLRAARGGIGDIAPIPGGDGC